MDISLILKIAGIGILVAIVNMVLSKTGKDEQATFVTIGGIIVVLLMLISEIGALIENVRFVFGI
jgi:stage III sporulation protein AC